MRCLGTHFFEVLVLQTWCREVGACTLQFCMFLNIYKINLRCLITNLICLIHQIFVHVRCFTKTLTFSPSFWTETMSQASPKAHFLETAAHKRWAMAMKYYCFIWQTGNNHSQKVNNGMEDVHFIWQTNFLRSHWKMRDLQIERNIGHLLQSSMLLIGGLVDMSPFILLPNLTVWESSDPDRFLKWYHAENFSLVLETEWIQIKIIW